MIKPDLKIIIEKYKKDGTHESFVKFQEKLKVLRNRAERLRKSAHHPYNESIDKIIQDIEEYQTFRYRDYIDRFLSLTLVKISKRILCLEYLTGIVKTS